MVLSFTFIVGRELFLIFSLPTAEVIRELVDSLGTAKQEGNNPIPKR